MSAAGSMALVAGCVGALLLALHVVQRGWHAGPELVRKLFHIGGGLVCLSLPALFTRAWPVALLGAGLTAGFLLLRRVPKIQVLTGAGRTSAGEICFPAGVVAAFAAAGGDRLDYSVAVLVLTFADAGAALVGRRVGRVPFGAGKTLEGSAAFGLLAFLSAFIPLMVNGGGPAKAFPVAAGLALAVTVVEALTPGGLDNLLIPITTLAALRGLLRWT